MENRNGLAVLGEVTRASGTAECDAALDLIDRRRAEWRITLGADKAYDVVDFVQELRAREVTPHIAIDGHVTKTGKVRKTAVDSALPGHPGYAVSQRCRKRIEEIFGWTKTTGAPGPAPQGVRGLAKANSVFTFALAAYNLIRLPKLLEAPTPTTSAATATAATNGASLLCRRCRSSRESLDRQATSPNSFAKRPPHPPPPAFLPGFYNSLLALVTDEISVPLGRTPGFSPAVPSRWMAASSRSRSSAARLQ